MLDASEISATDIAIVGMALRVPGANSVDAFWKNLIEGVESIRDLTPEERAAAERAGDPVHDPHYVARTSDLGEMEYFDADFFGLSPKEAAVMDPQHRHFLECAWEALEDAGRMPDQQKGPVGVFAASGMGSYFYFNVCSDRELVDQTGMFLLRHTGNDKDFLSTRVSFTLDLRGPSVNVQTACSSSLVAVHYAAQSLLNGECDMALAGGVTIEQPHRRGYTFQEGEILSPDGHCRAFDHRAAGTVFGSGVGVVALRRLSDAIADGDIIHAVIKGSAINNDGASKSGYLAPSVTGQAEAIIEAQGLAGIEPDSIGYVECHGTGTYLGDPIEIQALTEAFQLGTTRRNFCRVGSVKSNIGHLDTAAGVVSLIKAALTVKHGRIPPTLGFEKPNPAIDFASSPFVVNDKLTDWAQTAAPRRAGINSLGVGGTNAHVIIEQPPRVAEARQAGEREPTLLLLSAKNRKALDDAQARLGAYVGEHADIPLGDIAHTLLNGRKPFEHRAAIAVRDRTDAIAALTTPELKRGFVHSALSRPSGAAFLFPGGGAQHHGMGRELYRQDAQFRRIVDEGIGYLPAESAAQLRAAWLDADVADARLLLPSVQLPAILIVEIATARLWMARGLTPNVLIGHSMGENAAACIAGVLSFKDAVNLVRLRGELFETLPRGGMLSVPVSETELRGLLPDELDVASVNAPNLCVVSGPDAALDRFAEALTQKGIDANRIHIDVAAHSRMLEPILERFGAFLKTIRLSPPTIRIISNVTGETLSIADATSPDYWVRHLRSTVRFEQCLAAVSADPGLVFIEVGPSRALSSLAKAQGNIDANRVINSLPHPDEKVDDQLYFVTAIGRAWATGLALPAQSLVPQEGRKVSLPAYPFQHRKYFIERQDASSGREAPLLRHENMESWGYRPTWRRSVPDVLAGETTDSRIVVVFLDDGDTGLQLADRLRVEGHRVVTVAAGDGFARRGADSYVVCPEQGRAGYDALAAGLLADQIIPDQVLYLPLLTHTNNFRPGSSFFNRVQENGFQGLLHLTQALSEAEIIARLHMVVVTNGAQQVSGEGLVFPEKSTIEGPARVIPREFDGLKVRLVDIDLGQASTDAGQKTRAAKARPAIQPTPERIIDALLEEASASPSSEIVAWRGARRWTRGHAPMPLDAPGEDFAGLRHGGVYVLTGGLGDLALTFAQQLAKAKHARIALLARRSLPPRDHWPALERILPFGDRRRAAIAAIYEMEQAGGEVLLLEADVTNPLDIQHALDQVRARWGTITGVLHTAGLVDDAPLLAKSVEMTEHVLAPKVLGTKVLADALANEPIETFILFSSTSTDTAPTGQVDYVAANAFLNAFAESQKYRTDRKTLAIHWGIWNEVGMAARGLEEIEASARTIGPAKGPFFQRWAGDDDGAVWLETDATAASHWIFGEHRLANGEALMPGTGYVELIEQAIREAGLPPMAIENLQFRSPMFAPDGQTITVRLRFAYADGRYSFEIASAVGGDNLVNALADLAPIAEIVTEIDVKAIAQRCELGTVIAMTTGALRSAQEDHLRFGPRWKVLRSQQFGYGEAIAHLSLDARFAQDLAEGYLSHPGLLDIATGFAMNLVPGYDPAQALWAPASYGRIALVAPLPAQIVSWVRTVDRTAYGEGFASFDITLATPSGEVLMEVDNLLLKRLDAGQSFARMPAPKRIAKSANPVPSQLANQVRQGILPSQALEALERALASNQVQPIVSSMDLDALIRKADLGATRAKSSLDFGRSAEMDGSFVPPVTPTQIRLAAFWRDLLGVEQVGIEDSFFDIGGHSLIAVRLFRSIRKEFGIDLPISTLFERPTIALLAELLPQAETGDDALAPAAAPSIDLVHRVPMHIPADNGATPLFICAGMFGNVLNLRQLARQLGKDRAVYGLQAQGIYGDTPPHETFEEAAASCIAEMRAIQPEGPYLLAGFSGGGLVAYEMAQQLRAAGESVSHLVMLDTPLPTQPDLRLVDLVSMKLQELRREGPGYLTRYVGNRLAWEKEKRRMAEAGEQVHGASDRLNNEAVEAAFRRALLRYEVRPYSGDVTLFRPEPEIEYHLPNGRKLMPGRTLFFEDNGWTPFVDKLEVVVVPGNHDSMVLEPEVRVLADRMRKIYARVDVGIVARRAAE